LATGQNLLKTNAGDVKPSPRGPSASLSQPAASSSGAAPRADSNGKVMISKKKKTTFLPVSHTGSHD